MVWKPVGYSMVTREDLRAKSLDHLKLETEKEIKLSLISLSNVNEAKVSQCYVQGGPE